MAQIGLDPELGRALDLIGRVELPAADDDARKVVGIDEGQGRLLGANLAADPKLAAIAARLHVSERTLRRQLSQEGTSFHAIHDRLRIERALALLQEPKTSIAAVGAQVGFRDPREFRRAFKRWTGAPPSAARAQR